MVFKKVQGLQIIVFGWTMNRHFALEFGVDLEELPGESELESALR